MRGAGPWIRAAPRIWAARGIWAAAGVLAAAWLACTRPAQVLYEERLEAAPAPTRHAVQSARLAEHMRRLDQLRNARLPQGLDLEAWKVRQREVLREVAAELAASAQLIPEASGVSDLDAVERELFDGLAGRLAQEARALAQEASALSPKRLNDRLDRIDHACARCHSRFRIPTAPDDGTVR